MGQRGNPGVDQAVCCATCTSVDWDTRDCDTAVIPRLSPHRFPALSSGRSVLARTGIRQNERERIHWDRNSHEGSLVDFKNTQGIFTADILHLHNWVTPALCMCVCVCVYDDTTYAEKWGMLFMLLKSSLGVVDRQTKVDLELQATVYWRISSPPASRGHAQAQRQPRSLFWI